MNSQNMVQEENQNPSKTRMNAEPLITPVTSLETQTPSETENLEIEANQTNSVRESSLSSEEVAETDELAESTEIAESTKSSIIKVFPPQPLQSKQQISLIQKGDFVYITLPLTINSENNQWQRILDDFKTRLHKIDKSWLPKTKVHLQTQDRLLDTRQLQDLTAILAQVNLKLSLVITTRRQTAVAAASAGYSVQQESQEVSLLKNDFNLTQDLAEPLYLKHTIRSGEEIYHPSSVIICGDVNPGATIIAHGEIFVWGTLKGIAHAGATGNRQALIMALRMEPTQIRIADLVARAPDNPPDNQIAEVAYVSNQGIRIRAANSFTKTHVFIDDEKYWIGQTSQYLNTPVPYTN